MFTGRSLFSVVSDNNRRSALYMALPRCQAQSDATTQPRPSRRAGDQQPVSARSNAAAGYIRPSAVLIRKSAHREIGSDRGALDSARPADQNHQTPAGLRQCQGLANLKITREKTLADLEMITAKELSKPDQQQNQPATLDQKSN